MTVDRLEQIGREITARVGKLDQLGAKAVDQVDSIGHLLAEAEKLCETLEALRHQAAALSRSQSLPHLRTFGDQGWPQTLRESGPRLEPVSPNTAPARRL